MEIKREKSLDVAKGIAILAVIIGHIINLGVSKVLLYSFHLPIFFIISGYFFHEKYKWSLFLKKKVKVYLIPYVSCAIIIAGYKFASSGFDKTVLASDVVYFVRQERYTNLWFLTTLFFAVVFFRIIVDVCHNQIIGIIMVSAIVSAVFIYYDTYLGWALPWNIDASCIVLIFLAFGYCLRRYQVLETIFSQKNGIKILISAFLILVSILCTGFNHYLGGHFLEMFCGEYGIYPFTMIAACSASVSIIVIASMLKKTESLVWLGENTMVFFAFHQTMGIVPMERLAEMAGFSRETVSCWLPYYMFLFIGTMLVCGAIYMIIKKTHTEFILGK